MMTLAEWAVGARQWPESDSVWNRIMAFVDLAVGAQQ